MNSNYYYEISNKLKLNENALLNLISKSQQKVQSITNHINIEVRSETPKDKVFHINLTNDCKELTFDNEICSPIRLNFK